MRRTLSLPAWSTAVYAAVLLVALMLPFETIAPVLATPWVSLTDDRLVLAATGLVWLAAGRAALPTLAEWRALAPSVALLVVSVVAAVAAPVLGNEALKAAWRLLAATFVLLLTLRVARDPERLKSLLWAIVLGAGVSAAVGAGEALAWHALDPLLSLFKVAPTRVGGELRVSASFEYATIAAMYFEMVAPLAIVLSVTAGQRRLRLLGLGIALACTANIVLSLTRAGLLTLAVVYAGLLAAGCLKPAWRRLLLPTSAAGVVLVGGVVILALRSPVFDMRLATEDDAEWYGATYAVPATLTVEADQPATVGLDVRNQGRITWTSSGQHPFALGYRWLTADGADVLELPASEVPLTRDVGAGDTIHLQTRLDIPDLPAGTYRLDWGMLQRDVVQFYERGWADAETVVEVSQPPDAAAVQMPATLPRDDGEAPWVVGRIDLWTAAARMIEARPVIGVGLDNFRHLYGTRLGLDSWDERVQANNLYLELLADLGALGLGAFAWLMLSVLAPTVMALRAADTGRRAMWLLGCCLGLAAFLVHGLLDSFLAYTPTALLVWMLLGSSVALLKGESECEVEKTQKPHVSGR